jgi:type IV pilus biogenesis protein CpaD/CtpE
VSSRAVVLVVVLAHLVGCGSCANDEPQSEPVASGGRKPIDMRAADKRFSQFSEAGADASSD